MTACRRIIRVHYPVGEGEHMVLRTEHDWDRDVVPVRLSADGRTAEFELTAQRPFIYFKACLRKGDGISWMAGANRLIVLDVAVPADVHPYFRSSAEGVFEPPTTVHSAALGRDLSMRVYLPPGYAEAEQRRYPTVYMQDGKNRFFPDEAFLGHEHALSDLAPQLTRRRTVTRATESSGRRRADTAGSTPPEWPDSA